MARITQDDFASQNGSQDSGIVEIDAHGQTKIEVPSNEFISDSSISRESQDLVLEAPDGNTLIINNYFSADPAPVIESPDGSILTSNLINSFLQSTDAQFAQNISLTDESPVGAIEEIEGEAKVIRADGTSETATLGTPIYNGDVIETSADGAVNVIFIDETSMAVSENARLAIDNYQYDPSTESGETNLSVLRGVFVFTSGLIGRDDPDDVLIETPVGSIGIRGTIIAGKIQPGGESEITVVEGAIVVKNGIMETTLSQQYETIKLGGFNDNMQDLGVKSAGDVGETYGSVSDVVPKLFSSINDSAKEAGNTDAPQDQEKNEDVIENQEQETEEIIDEPVQEETLSRDESLLEGTDLGIEGETLNKPTGSFGEEDNKQPREYNTYKEGKNSSFDDTIYYNGPQGPDGPTFHFNTRPVFEYSKAGDVVATIAINNAPAGMSYNIVGPGAANFTVFTVNNGFAEVKLSAAGAITSTGAVGTALGTITLQAIFPNSNIVDWNLSPVTQDAAVNISSSGGLDYHVTNAPAPIHEKIGDFNGDGVKDYVDGNPLANSGDGVVDIIDGSTNTPMQNIPGTTGMGLGHSVTGVGDVDNDGYADVIAGGPNAGNGDAILIHGSTGAPSTTPTTGGSAGDQYGFAVSSAGDFDGDGKSDYAVTAPSADGPGTDRGELHIHTDSGVIIFDGNSDNMELGEHVSYLGDVDGDGLSDLLVSARNTVAGNYEAFIIRGGAGGGTVGADKVSTNQQIVAGGGVGDINGDGYDDFAVSLDDGTDINTYVVYGQSSPLGTMNLAYLENPDNALKIHDAGASGSNYQVTAVGDVNGDGFDDVQIGVVGGSQHVVHGDIGGTAAYATDESATDGSSPLPGVLSPANSSVKSLVGDVHFIDNGETGLSMRGGDGNNHFSITADGADNTTFINIDGGRGNQDTIRFGETFGTIDFGNVNFEQISQIERIHFTQDNSTIRLTAENIFNMLKTSDNGSLTIELGASGGTPATNGTLLIEAAADHSDDPTGIVNALNEEGIGATYVGTSGGNDHFQIGGYDLYIDTDLTTQVVV